MKSTIGVFIRHCEGFEYQRLLTEELMVLVEFLQSVKQYMYANNSNAITECGLGIVSDGRTNKIHFQFALDDLLLLKSKEIV